MSTGALWVLGAPDPEMTAIERVLRDHGELIAFADDGADRLVTAGGAYRACCEAARGWSGVAYMVECAVDVLDALVDGSVDCDCAVYRVDHHRPGDPGYGKGPADFWAASSLGQVCAILGIAPTPEYFLIAAADHCLGAAYRGECPGVDPDRLIRWRMEQRAALQRRPVAEVLGDFYATTGALRRAVFEPLAHLADMRRDSPWPELVDAATYAGIGYIAGPLRGPDGVKYTCSGSPAQVHAWMAHWAPSQGLVGIYGDPARGFAGAYAPAAEVTP